VGQKRNGVASPPFLAARACKRVGIE
jgi:hypothetical protein